MKEARTNNRCMNAKRFYLLLYLTIHLESYCFHPSRCEHYNLEYGNWTLCHYIENHEVLIQPKNKHVSMNLPQLSILFLYRLYLPQLSILFLYRLYLPQLSISFLYKLYLLQIIYKPR